MPFFSINAHPHGHCWVEAPDAEAVMAVVREHYGHSVAVEWCRDADDRPIWRAVAPADRCYLGKDANWHQNDGAPMLSRAANLLMAFGATYQEALAYQVADQDGNGAARKAVADLVGERNRVAARAKALEAAVAKAQELGVEHRGKGRRTDHLSDYEMRGLLRDPTQEEREAVLAAYRGGAG